MLGGVVLLSGEPGVGKSTMLLQLCGAISMTLFTHLTKMDRATIQGALQGIRSRAEFQAKFFGPAIQSLINTTTDGITVSGMELVDKNTSYIFMSNHRDIILDSAILNVLLRQHGNKYTRAAIGSNLLINDWVTDLVKLDSCFVIERDITVREMLTSSALRSKYIREVIEENEDSVWIAEREGRTKNGDDKAQPPYDALKTSELYTKTVGEYIKLLKPI